MANGSKGFWNNVMFGIAFGAGVMILNGVVNMARRYTGLPPGEFSL